MFRHLRVCNSFCKTLVSCKPRVSHLRQMEKKRRGFEGLVCGKRGESQPYASTVYNRPCQVSGQASKTLQSAGKAQQDVLKRSGGVFLFSAYLRRSIPFAHSSSGLACTKLVKSSAMRTQLAQLGIIRQASWRPDRSMCQAKRLQHRVPLTVELCGCIKHIRARTRKESTPSKTGPFHVASVNERITMTCGLHGRHKLSSTFQATKEKPNTHHTAKPGSPNTSTFWLKREGRGFALVLTAFPNEAR